MKALPIILLLVLASVTFADDLCYQETATLDTPCGGVGDGSYALTSSWINGGLEIYDGNWSTYDTKKVGISEYALLYINYSQPPVSSAAIWQVKDDDQGEYNISIPESCFNQPKLQLYTQAKDEGNGYYCYNGATWSSIGSSYYNSFYEEGIFWNTTTHSLSFYDACVSNYTQYGPNRSYIERYVQCSMGRIVGNSESGGLFLGLIVGGLLIAFLFFQQTSIVGKMAVILPIFVLVSIWAGWIIYILGIALGLIVFWALSRMLNR